MYGALCQQQPAGTFLPCGALRSLNDKALNPFGPGGFTACAASSAWPFLAFAAQQPQPLRLELIIYTST